MKRLAIMLAAVALLVTHGIQARPLFPRPVHLLDWVSEPVGVVTADLDDDGDLDLVVGGEGGGIDVLLGSGGGSFEPVVAYDTGGASWFPTVGDLNEDGILDVVVGNLGILDVSVLFGNGDGTFGEESRYDIPFTLKPGQTVIRDFDEDGHQDLRIKGWFNTEDVNALMTGRGDGTFDTAVQLPGIGVSVTAADFDGDGHEDYATGYEVYAGNGDGTFVLRDILTHGGEPVWVDAGDLDGDGILDLAIADRISDDVSVVIGNGDGTFGPERRFTAGTHQWFVAIGDLNEDGLQDLAVSACDGNDPCLALLFGTGGGEFAPPNYLPAFWQGNTAIGDFDDDGFEDLAHANYQVTARDVRIVFGNGDGTFAESYGFGVGENPWAVAVDDLDGDGRQDVVTANHDSSDVSVLLANGAGTFEPEMRFAVSPAPAWVAIAELTGDGIPDLATANSESPGTVSLLQGTGDGSFSALGSLPVGSSFPPSEPSFVAAADLDGDVDRDLVVSDGSSDRISVFLGHGDGTFEPQVFVTVGRGASWIEVARLDGDDVPDLAVANTESDSVSVLLGIGDGTYVAAPTLVLPGDQKPSSAVAGDLDGDGAADLAVACPESERINIFYGNGDGTFPIFPQTIPLDYFHDFRWRALLVTDLNGDGNLDLVSSTYNGRFGVLIGNGYRSFSPVQYFLYGRRTFAAGDFNLDGKTDLVSQGVSVLLNQTGPSALTFLGDRATLIWPAATGALSYDVYRGNLAALVDNDDDGLPDAGYGACMTGLDDDARDTFFVDAEIPSPEGTGFFYLISIIDSEGDQGLGTTSAGLAREAQVPCP